MNAMIKNLTTMPTLIIASVLVTSLTALAQKNSPTPETYLSQARALKDLGLEVTTYAPGSDAMRFKGSTHIAFGPGVRRLFLT